MELNEYQAKAMGTCLPSCDNFGYMMLNLVGEVGEFASKVAKHIRKKEMFIGSDGSENELLSNSPTDGFVPELRKEAGDILWQLAGLCYVMGWPLEVVGRENLEKLRSRAERGKIDGDGDNR